MEKFLDVLGMIMVVIFGIIVISFVCAVCIPIWIVLTTVIAALVPVEFLLKVISVIPVWAFWKKNVFENEDKFHSFITLKAFDFMVNMDLSGIVMEEDWV